MDICEGTNSLQVSVERGEWERSWREKGWRNVRGEREREERRKGRGRGERKMKAADVIERVHTEPLMVLQYTLSLPLSLCPSPLPPSLPPSPVLYYSVEVEATDGPPADMAQNDSPETIEVHNRHTLHITTLPALLMTCCRWSYS